MCRGAFKLSVKALDMTENCLSGHHIWAKAAFFFPKFSKCFTSLINTSNWLVPWALAMCILVSAACRTKTCKLQAFLQSTAKSQQKAWLHSLSLLLCPWLTQCHSQELACPKSRSLLAPLCQQACLPISFCLSVSVPCDTHTMPGQGSRGLFNPYRGPLFRDTPPPPSFQWRV